MIFGGVFIFGVFEGVHFSEGNILVCVLVRTLKGFYGLDGGSTDLVGVVRTWWGSTDLVGLVLRNTLSNNIKLCSQNILSLN